jgi:transposase-like protein
VSDFLRSLVERGLCGVQLVVSDAHAGLKKAIAQTPAADRLSGSPAYGRAPTRGRT